MADEPSELELKFLVDPRRVDDVWRALGGRAGKGRALTSIYFDTPKRRLRSRGLSLRLRGDGRRWVQTVKTRDVADGGLGRGEWEGPAKGPQPDLTLARGSPVPAALSATSKLAPVFQVRVQRRTRVLHEEGAVIEAAFDLGEVQAGRRSVPLCELELELKSGSSAALIAAGARIAGSLGLFPSFTTKAQRGYALASGHPGLAAVFEAPVLSGVLTAGTAFRIIARAALSQIAGNAEFLRAGPTIEAVHQMRVGVRRLRSVLATFKSVVADRRLPALEAELTWLTGELDPARNLDVLLAGAYPRAVARGADPAGLTTLGRRLRDAKAMAYVRARSAAESPRLTQLIMDLLAWLEVGEWLGPGAPGEGRRGETAAVYAAQALGKRFRKVRRRGKDLSALTVEERHQVRIEAKKLRYAADVFAPMFGKSHRAGVFLEALKTLQDDLGDLNDIATARFMAGGTLGNDGPAALLLQGDEAQEARLLASAVRRFKALLKAKPFWPD